MNGQRSEILKIPIFGHSSVGLGSLYSHVEQKFLPGSSFWDPEVIKDYSDVIFHPKQDTFWTSPQTKEDIYDMFGLDVTGSVGVNLPVGGVKATGTIEYIMEEKVSQKFMLKNFVKTCFTFRILNSLNWLYYIIFQKPRQKLSTQIF